MNRRDAIARLACVVALPLVPFAVPVEEPVHLLAGDKTTDRWLYTGVLLDGVDQTMVIECVSGKAGWVRRIRRDGKGDALWSADGSLGWDIETVHGHVALYDFPRKAKA